MPKTTSAERVRKMRAKRNELPDLVKLACEDAKIDIVPNPKTGGFRIVWDMNKGAAAILEGYAAKHGLTLAELHQIINEQMLADWRLTLKRRRYGE